MTLIARVRIDGGLNPPPPQYHCSFYCDPQPLSSCCVAAPLVHFSQFEPCSLLLDYYFLLIFVNVNCAFLNDYITSNNEIRIGDQGFKCICENNISVQLSVNIVDGEDMNLEKIYEDRKKGFLKLELLKKFSFWNIFPQTSFGSALISKAKLSVTGKPERQTSAVGGKNHYIIIPDL